ncbi:MAG: hypothetical protein AAF740_13340, partial [Bacteroidota bacterium]
VAKLDSYIIDIFPPDISIPMKNSRKFVLAENTEAFNYYSEFSVCYPEVNLEVRGHTDTERSFWESEFYAFSVMNILAEKYRIPLTNLSLKGYGSSRPSAPETVDGKRDPINIVINNRVEFGMRVEKE